MLLLRRHQHDSRPSPPTSRPSAGTPDQVAHLGFARSDHRAIVAELVPA